MSELEYKKEQSKRRREGERKERDKKKEAIGTNYKRQSKLCTFSKFVSLDAPIYRNYKKKYCLINQELHQNGYQFFVETLDLRHLKSLYFTNLSFGKEMIHR